MVGGAKLFPHVYYKPTEHYLPNNGYNHSSSITHVLLNYIWYTLSVAYQIVIHCYYNQST